MRIVDLRPIVRLQPIATNSPHRAHRVCRNERSNPGLAVFTGSLDDSDRLLSGEAIGGFGVESRLPATPSFSRCLTTHPASAPIAEIQKLTGVPL